jgi:Zn-dependent protease
MFFEPNRTAYDLNFRIFGVDVRIHPFFWLVSALLGPHDLGVEHGVLLLFVWIACVFLSILLHELGHVLMGRLFGSRGHIVLYSFGGLAIGSSDLRRRWQRIAVLLAGPGIQLVLFALVAYLVGGVIPDVEILRARLALIQAGTPRVLVGASLLFLWQINLFWPFLNLLPIWPLDGGQVSRELCTWVSRRRGIRFSLGISFAVAAFLAVHALADHFGHPIPPRFPTGDFAPPTGDLYTALLFGMLAFSSFQYLRALDQHQPWDEDYGLRKW